jgi:hypothetical protein
MRFHETTAKPLKAKLCNGSEANICLQPIWPILPGCLLLTVPVQATEYGFSDYCSATPFRWLDTRRRLVSII